MPQCGFSSRVAGVLNYMGVEFKDVNVLADAEIRQGIKDFSDWPTIPQLYVKGEFVGGCDIVTEMTLSGELDALLEAKGVRLRQGQGRGDPRGQRLTGGDCGGIWGGVAASAAPALHFCNRCPAAGGARLGRRRSRVVSWRRCCHCPGPSPCRCPPRARGGAAPAPGGGPPSTAPAAPCP